MGTYDEELAAEIARVAALRGKSKDWIDEKTAPEAVQRSMRTVVTFNPSSLLNTTEDLNYRTAMAAFDRLPRASRDFINFSPLGTNVLTYSRLLDQVGDESVILDALRKAWPELIRRNVIKSYPPGHPQAAAA